MSKKTLSVKRQSSGAILPIKQSEGAAGFDLCIPIEDLNSCCKRLLNNRSFIVNDVGDDIQHQKLTLPAGEALLVDTGFSMEIPEGFEGQVRSRSGWGTKGLVVMHGVGTIDSDYRGRIKIPLMNIGERGVTLKPGDRVAQLVVSPISSFSEITEKTLSDTSRGTSGFGSTGVGHA